EEMDVNMGKVDVDENQELATDYGVRSIPTFLILSDGEEVARTMGAMNKDEFRDWVEENS
ncbi:MAG: thioredoxin family protein, partial [Candidatus Nanohaloarchaea archaeon]|nr:thioredoxin family protein [Candidatus Nanohaloarchaea archaeon]